MVSEVAVLAIAAGGVVATVAISMFASRRAQAKALRREEESWESHKRTDEAIETTDWDQHPDGVDIEGRRWWRVHPGFYTTTPPEEWHDDWRNL